MKNTKKCKSITQTSIVMMILYTIIIVVLIFSATSLISIYISRSFPNMHNLLAHEKILKNDAYIKLPNYILEHGRILIYDANNQVIYSNDEKVEKSLQGIEIDLIPSYDYQKYYNVIMNDEFQEYEWCIEKYEYNTASEEFTCIGNCYLDEFRNVINGTIFTEKKSFSDKEIRIMQGIFSDEEMVEKYNYITNDGMDRTLVYIYKNLQYSQYEEVVKEANIIWIYIVILIIILLLGAAMLGSNFARKSIQPLQDAMSSYAKGEAYDLNIHKVPTEYENIVITFNNLVESLETAQKEKQRILADISHDLRTPLTVIKGLSEAVLDNIVDEKKSMQYIDVINQKADLCSKLIDTLIIYTKLDHPEYILNKKKVNISSLCINYLANKYPELELQRMTLDVDIPEHDIFFECDKEMITRVFDNIVSNAIKYAGENSQLIFHLRKEGNEIIIKIADTGRGIPFAIRNRIFDAFIVADETRKSGKGIGLGLSIAKKIIELHDGTIQLSEKPERGTGTEFIIKFNL